MYWKEIIVLFTQSRLNQYKTFIRSQFDILSYLLLQGRVDMVVEATRGNFLVNGRNNTQPMNL